MPDTPSASENPDLSPQRRTWKRRTGRALRRLALGAAGLIALLVAAAAYIVFVGVTIDASPVRERLARAFSESLHREVRFDGPAMLEISARPWLRVGGLHVSDPGGFDEGTLATLGEVRLAMDLWPLLNHQLHIRELSGQDAAIRLSARADGSNNWTFQFPAAASPANPPPESRGGGKDVALMLDIGSISLQRIRVEYAGQDRRSHFFDLARLEGSSPFGKPLTLAMQGNVEKSFPYEVRLAGGPLSDLVGSEKPWPFNLRVEFLSTALNLEGRVQGTSGDVQFAVGTENLGELERLLQTTFPKVGATALAGHVAFTPQRVDVTGITGVMGRTSLTGSVTADRSGKRPRISGSLSLPTLDLRPFLTDAPDEDEEPPRSLRDTYRELSKATFSLRSLRAADVDLRLAVDRWLSLPGDVHDVKLHLRLTDGRLEVPIEANMAGVAMSGNLLVDGSLETPRFRVALGTRDSPLGGLAELLAGARGMQGHLGRFSLELSAEGDQGSELMTSLDVRLALAGGRLTYGNVDGGRPVEFGLDQFEVALPAHKPLRGSARGTLLRQPFVMSLSGGTLERVMQDERSPVDLRIRSGSVRAALSGIAAAPTDTSGPEVSFDISADRTDDVARWLGIPAGASARVGLRGKASMTANDWALQGLLLRVGKSTVRVDASSIAAQTPPLRLRVDAEHIDAGELQSLVPQRPGKPAAAAGPGRPVLEIPILPKGIDLGDADVQIRVARIGGTALDPRDIAFDGRIRDGAMQPSSFSAVIADIPFRGAVSLDMRGAEPQSSLWLSAGDIDVGKLLKRLGLASDLDARVGAVRLALTARSSLLGDLLAKSELIGNIDDASVTLRDRNTKAQATIELQSGELSARPGQPLRLDLDGRIDETPIRLNLKTAKAVDLVRPEGRIPFDLTAGVPDLEVRLHGTVAKPVGTRDIVLGLKVRGSRFDRLNGLARASLPPWGPYALSGLFRMSARGYEVDDLTVRVGSSSLQGRGSLDTTGARPRLDVALKAPSVQIDDFRFGDWTPVEKKPESSRPMTAEELKAKAATASDEAQKLLSPAVLGRQDVFIGVQVDEVLSGSDRLGSGRLEARLENGRADVGPVEVNVPGGSARLWLGYEPTDRDVKVDTRMKVDRFDYGVLARRLKPGTDLEGTFSLDVDVNSRTRYLSDILESGNGHIDFAVWPRNMRSGIFDLWAVNVLVALVPAVDPSTASKINCAVGRFELRDGRLRDRTIVLDTTRMRVTGKGSADFHDEKMNLRLKPVAKVPQFLSLATPIEVKGTFGDFSIGVSAGDVLGTIGRFASSIFWAPIQKLVAKEIPADGRDVCSQGLSGTAR